MAWQTNEITNPSFYDRDTEARLKLLFAAAILRHPHNLYDAAREVETDNGRANWIVNNWASDPIVLDAISKRVAELGPALAGLPTKEELAAKIYNEAADVKDKSTKLAYYRAVADVMGYIAKGGVGININNNIVNGGVKVQRVPVFATDADWEAKAKLVEARLAEMAGDAA